METLDLYIFSFFQLEIFFQLSLNYFFFPISLVFSSRIPRSWVDPLLLSSFVIIALMVLIIGPFGSVLSPAGMSFTLSQMLASVSSVVFCRYWELLFVFLFLYRLKCQSYILSHPGGFFFISTCFTQTIYSYLLLRMSNNFWKFLLTLKKRLPQDDSPFPVLTAFSQIPCSLFPSVCHPGRRRLFLGLTLRKLCSISSDIGKPWADLTSRKFQEL